MMPLPTLIILTGPTGIGKSEMGVSLARELETEIISADSMQVYQHFDVGTAKPPPELRNQVRHHLMDFIHPQDEYNVYLFRQDAEKLISEFHRKGKTPLVVGGTGLYIKALTEGLDCGSRPGAEIREAITEEMKIKGTEKMHEELAVVDPVSANAINPNDSFRIQRALETYRETGRPLSELHLEDREKAVPQYKVICLVLNMPREKLYARIENRVDAMLEAGLIREVQDLLDKGFSRESKPFMGLGYKQVLAYLDGADTFETMVRNIKKETRHYAKRQLTWFRKTRDAVWVNMEEEKGKTLQQIKTHIEELGV